MTIITVVMNGIVCATWHTAVTLYLSNLTDAMWSLTTLFIIIICTDDVRYMC